jgi:hypothetical protein
MCALSWSPAASPYGTGVLRGWLDDSENSAEGQLKRAGVVTSRPNLARLLAWARALHALLVRGQKRRGRR